MIYPPLPQRIIKDPIFWKQCDDDIQFCSNIFKSTITLENINSNKYLLFESCTFHQNIRLHKVSNKSIEFINCQFENSLVIRDSNPREIWITDCSFLKTADLINVTSVNIILHGNELKENIKLQNCCFLQMIIG